MFSVQIQIHRDHFFEVVQNCTRVMQMTFLYLLNAFAEQTVSKDNSAWVMTHTGVGVEYFGPLSFKGIHKLEHIRCRVLH